MIFYDRNSVIWLGVPLLFRRMELYCTSRDEQSYELYSDHQSCAVTMRVTKADRQRNENSRWKANSGTRLCHDVVHGDVCRALKFVDRATVTARLRFSLLCVFEDRYTLQSVVTVGGPRLVDLRFTFRIGGVTLVRCSIFLPETVLYSD